MIATDVVVQSFLTDSDSDNTVNVFRTFLSDLCFPDGKTNVLLATGAIPATTILLNSLESELAGTGTRATSLHTSRPASRSTTRASQSPAGARRECSAAASVR